MMAVDIYGSLVYHPDAPDPIRVEGWGLPASEQKWKRKDIPAIFDNIKYNSEGNAILTAEQESYAEREVRRCIDGYYFFNNGTLTYITGKHYFYLQWWKLEDDIYPDYRDTDRRYYLFLNHWENIPWCLGILRGKKRREGASSQATANLVYECVFFTNSNCGLISKTRDDSRDTFTDMVRHGYNQLPVFLKPRQLSKIDTVSELLFASKHGDGGQKSKINYRAPVLNAYDRGRMTRILVDEGGKWPPEVPFSKFIAIVSKTMIKGVKRVGFAECPSTVNELTKGGGAEFKKAWDMADQSNKKRNGRVTLNRFVTYFSPAYDGYDGFIDAYGQSVIGEPTEEQYEYLVNKYVVKDTNGETISELSEEDIKKGARYYVTITRRQGLEGTELEEEIRMNPCTVQEMFEAANTGCVFNSYKINQRVRELEESDIFKRPVRFTVEMSLQEDGSHKREVKWRDIIPSEQNFHWRFTWMPRPGEENKSRREFGQLVPDRQEDGVIAVDSYSNSQGGRKYGSKACALIGRRGNLLDPQNTGKVVGMLYGRPLEKDDLHEQVMLAAEYFGYKVYYEHTADDYFGYFKDRGMLGYLGEYPLSLIDPTKRGQSDRYKGTPITPFSLTKQLDNGISYFEHHCDKIDFIEILSNALLFDPYDRTAYDVVVSFLILISCLMETAAKPKPRKNKIRQYANSSYVPKK